MAIPAALTSAVGSLLTNGLMIAVAVAVAYYSVFAIKWMWKAASQADWDGEVDPNAGDGFELVGGRDYSFAFSQDYDLDDREGFDEGDETDYRSARAALRGE